MVVVGVGCFVLGWYMKPTEERIVEHTIVKYDTVTVDSLVPVHHYHKRTDTVRLECIDTCYETDSVLVEIPIDTYIYDTVVDSCRVRMVVDGYDVFVDEVSVQYPKTYITTVEYRKRNFFREHFRLGGGLSAGYGFIHKQFDVYAGVGVYMVW